jgi:hypothetical protein
MADDNASRNRDKAEGDRSTTRNNESTSRAGEEVAGRYDQSGDEGGGITNRPLDEEVENQEQLPERGRKKDEGGGRTSDTDRGNER